MLGCLVMAQPAPATLAAELQVIPSVALREEFNDNIFFSDAARRSSFISTVSAGVGVLERNERGGVAVSSRLDRLIYTGNGELDGFEQRHALQGNYRLSPRAELMADASFSHETRPDRYVESTGLVVRQDSDHQKYAAGAAVTLSESLAGDLSYSYRKGEYGNSSSSDVEAHRVQGSLEYVVADYLPSLKFRSGVSFDSYRYEAVLVRNYGAAFGASCRIGETWSAKGDLGARFTHSRFKAAPFPTQDAAGERDEAGWVASLAAVYRGEDDDDRAIFTVRRDLQSAPGRPGTVEETSAAVSYARRLSTELTGALGVGWYRNRSSAVPAAFRSVDQSSVLFHPSLTYRISREVAVELSYQYARVDDRVEGSDLSRNKVFVSLTGQMFIPR